MNTLKNKIHGGRTAALNKKIIRFLWVSFVCLLILCVSVFLLINRFMIRQNTDTLNQVVDTYMKGMSAQLQQHFQTLVNLRLGQVEGIVRVVRPDSETQLDEEERVKLEMRGRAQGFSYLSIYSTEGEAEVIYGDDLTIEDESDFLEAMNSSEKMVTIGETNDGEVILLYGISVGYPDGKGYAMSNGRTCTALLAGVPVSNLSKALALEENNSLIYTHIIRYDGTFIVKNSNLKEDNCYEWLRKCGYEDGVEDIDDIVERMKQTVMEQKECSILTSIFNEGQHVYCVPMPNTEWSMVTVMPHSILDEALADLGSQRIWTSLAGCGILVLATLLVFAMYFRLSLKQMSELDKVRKEAEHASQAKSEFLANMSHDIRTPMNAIVGMTAIATTNIDKPEQVKDCLRKITLSSRHLLGLINDVLDMSKIESGKLTLNKERTSLREVMESIVGIVQPQTRARRQQFDILVQNVEEEVVCCDGVRLNQVLINLLSNALKFTPAGGRIEVSVSQEASPKGANYVRTHFWVRDTGMGMSEEFQKHIFESFAREDSKRVHRTEGSGLGMAITKYIVDAMQGEIQVKSELNRGSEFHIILDLEKEDQPEENMILKPWDVLVVDDDEQLCISAAEALEEIGQKAEWVMDGPSAVEKARKRHDEHRDYQAILLDWQMPGMDGIETARRIRETIGEDITILLISAYDWTEIEEDAKKAGVNGFISKPLFKSTLYYGLGYFMDDTGETPEAAEDALPDFEGRRLLVAEDNELNWEIADELLSSFGFILTWAENGEICVEKFCQSEPGYYDAILMDLRMPVMNGYEATEAIRSSGREDSDIPIVAMTADAFSEDIRRCMEYGMNAHTAKPLDMREILRILHQLL